MGLTQDVISEFVKIANSGNKTTPTETTVNGTAVTYEGRTFVRVDGSDALTPVTPTVSMKDGDRVQVLIKDHTATATGNVSDPAASSNTVKEQGTKISEFEIIIADKVSVDELEAERARIKDLETDNVVIKNQLTATEANIQKLTAADATITGRLDANEASIINLDTEKLSADMAELTYATIVNLEATDAKIYNLSAVYGDFEVLATGKFEAIQADITSLETDKLSATDAELLYANIDFANIGEAAVKALFAKSGIIKELTTGDAFITGELVGVTIDGDLIKGNTIIADKLVIKGEDGLYYQMNVDGGATVSEEITEEQLQNGLHGDIIIANTITANKIKVEDLVAFGATIGGFHIVGSTEDKPGAIYSGVKESVNNATRGTYLDEEGQVAVGDVHNFMKFYKDDDGAYRLAIAADSVVFGSSGKSIESELSNIEHNVESNKTAAENSTLKIEEIKSLLRQIVTDENGQSLMITTEESYTLTDEAIEDPLGTLVDGVTTTTGEVVYVGMVDDIEVYYSIVDSTCYKVVYNPETCTFNISDIESAINSANNNVANLSGRVNDVDAIVNQVQKTVTDLAILGGYVVINENFEVKNEDGTSETVPAIILGASGSDFKVVITNKQIAFYEGSTVPAYISGQTLIAQRIEVKVELAQTAPDNSGQFVWKIRANGNYGLSWKEGVS